MASLSHRGAFFIVVVVVLSHSCSLYFNTGCVKACGSAGFLLVVVFGKFLWPFVWPWRMTGERLIVLFRFLTPVSSVALQVLLCQNSSDDVVLVILQVSCWLLYLVSFCSHSCGHGE